jgi:hypothetical protein
MLFDFEKFADEWYKNYVICQYYNQLIEYSCSWETCQNWGEL